MGWRECYGGDDDETDTEMHRKGSHLLVHCYQSSQQPWARTKASIPVSYVPDGAPITGGSWRQGLELHTTTLPAG